MMVYPAPARYLARRAQWGPQAFVDEEVVHHLQVHQEVGGVHTSTVAMPTTDTFSLELLHAFPVRTTL